MEDARKNHYAIGAVIEAADEMKSPVIILTTPSTLRYAKTTVFAAIVAQLAKSAMVPVVMHLDHGNS
jgi:tagatose 1,6-diphosphate aldolase GatY/KbaY